MRATKPGGLVFNFSELPAAPNDLYKKAATPRLKRAEAEKSPVIVVEDDGSPLFEPLGDQTPDQTEVGHRLRPPHICLLYSQSRNRWFRRLPMPEVHASRLTLK